ncbi:O-antigen ligase family protein [Clostridium vincentii]|uniref:O-Antigen ligase n=1 Tax=Clostridium vincentii TaxID=52704 RepID=A0A2T0BG92_9CLOT|nr:O-antigen ligase family protein [Clostridium vincentii]PRR82916.1 O-Antigen ligase [Clostridium vincentii]
MINKLFRLSFIGYLFLYPLIPTIVIEKLPVGDLLMLLYMVLFFIKSISSKNECKKLLWRLKDSSKDLIIISMIITIVIMGISTVYASSKTLAISESFRYLTYLILYIVIKYEFNIKNNFSKLKFILIVPAFISFSYGIVQYFTGIGVTVDTNGVLRMESTLGYPTAFAAYIIVLIFPLMIFSLKEKNIKIRIFYLTNVALGIINLIFSYSRNGWLALALGMVLLAILYNIKFLYLLLSFGAVGLLIPFIRKRFLQLAFSSTVNEGRLKLWEAAFKMIKDHPLKGIGNGNFSYLINDVEKFPELYAIGHSGFPTHNSYLKMWCEIGPIGGLLFLSTYIFMGIKLYINNTKYSTKFLGFTTGALITFFTFLFLNLFDNMMFTPKVMTIFITVVSMSLTISSKDYN